MYFFQQTGEQRGINLSKKQFLKKEIKSEIKIIAGLSFDYQRALKLKMKVTLKSIQSNLSNAKIRLMNNRACLARIEKAELA